ncbi:hypothetical protein OAQ99_04105 [Candidatus Kapabacteria bacterium]|nr:hypothetical protein [Candidatus Kapabacteria bacterium]
MKLLLFISLFFIMSCDDNENLAGKYDLLTAEWDLEAIYVNDILSSNNENIKYIFNENQSFIRIDDNGAESGTWLLDSKNVLVLNWESSETVKLRIVKLDSKEFSYNVFLDQGTGASQLSLTYSFIKSNSSG